MTVETSIVAFVLGSVVSLLTSWLLVTRLERVGDRLGASEALLGMVAALAADAPEITASVTALAHHQRTIGAGVVIGSNVFNLAALLGLGAVVAGRIRLDRKVIVLGGALAMVIATLCLLALAGVAGPVVALVAVLAVLIPYLVVLSVDHSRLGRLPLPRSWIDWITSAIVEEEIELEEAIHPSRGTGVDALLAGVALAVVVAASIAMEQGASHIGHRYNVAEIIIGGLVLAAVTSLPNAVAATYLARRGRGAAAFSTALNSNAINVTAGLLIPASFIGLARPAASGYIVVGWYVGLTALTLVLAYWDRGLRRSAGWLIIAGYAAFVGVLLATT